MKIRTATLADAQMLTKIYNYYIQNTVVTFEEDPILPHMMETRIADTMKDSLPWLVAETSTGTQVGYAYASKWKGRCAYRHSVETTVYLAKDQGGKGLGSQLYKELLQQLSESGIHVVIGGISLPNRPSVSLHEKFGFEKAGEFSQVGFKFGKWVDVGYWQKILD